MGRARHEIPRIRESRDQPAGRAISHAGQAHVVVDSTGCAQSRAFFLPAGPSGVLASRLAGGYLQVVSRMGYADSPAQRIGLMSGDRILRYDGEKPTSVNQMINLVRDFSGRASWVLIIGRGSQTLTFEIAPSRLGVTLDIVQADAGSNLNLIDRQTNQAR
jgi:C-terminal processing protease CtpA/Prc